MSAVAMDATWHEPALAMRSEGLDATVIGERLGKHPATIRKLFARNPGPDPESNGNGHGPLDHDTAERLREAAGMNDDDAPIPGQIDIDGGEVSHRDLHDTTILVDPEDSLDRFKEEAGEAVGPMPPREMDAGEITHVEEIRVDGSTQFAFECGGRTADDGTLTLAGAVNVDGFYRKGDRIYGTFEAVVTGVAVKDKLDKKTGVIKDTGQSHVAKVTALVVDGWKN